MNLSTRCLLLAAAFSLTRAVAAQEAQEVVVSPQIVGRTPERIGFVSGEVLPGSNVPTWLRYSEANAARFWWPYSVWPARPAPWDGDNRGNSLARFESERAALRRDPAAQIDWASFGARVSTAFGGTPPGTIGHAFALSEMKKMGASTLLMLSHPRAQMPFATVAGEPDWFGRWTYWRGVYCSALYLARTYQVERFQLFNEPDHSASAGFEQADFLSRLQLGSDAIQAALDDANRLDGTKLTPRISAPVTAGLTVYNARAGRSDQRDAVTGWGELTVRALRSSFAGRSDGNRGLFQAYAFQNYAHNPQSIASRLPALIERIARDNGGQRLPVIASELNVSTAADFAKTPATLDTPEYYAALGATATAYTNAALDEAYVFRLTQSLPQSLTTGETTKKNGVFLIDSRDPRKNIARSTKSAEAARLWMRGFRGARTRFAAPTAPADLWAMAARDQSGTHTLMLSNLGAARALSLDVAPWKLQTGALATIEEVSEAHHGDIARVLSLPASNKIPLAMSANSIALVTIRPALSGSPQHLQVLADAPSPNILRLEQPIATGGCVLLALTIKAAQVPLRVRVYGGAGGAGDVAGSEVELLGQVTPGAEFSELIVDATRYAAAPRGPLVFQIVAEEGTARPFEIGGGELRVFEARRW